MKLHLSVASVSSTQQLLDSLKDTLDDICHSSANELVKNGTKNAVMFNALAPKSGLEDNTISGAYDSGSGKGYIKMQGPNAVYDEFGTGEEGKDNPHPLAGVIHFSMPPYYGYVTGPFVREHINPANGRHYWIYTPNKSLPSYEPSGYTEGIPAGKQMYSTLEFVQKEKQRTISKVANIALKKYNK